jgi:phosphoribosylaminoimidazole-succinocarboxamide synthase
MINHKDLIPFLGSTLDSTNFTWLGEKYVGKVRDVYIGNNKRYIIATDRQSAFDISWCSIPLKGQVLNQISSWWFQQINDIMPSHLLQVPDENVSVVKDLKMLPLEIVVRDYITGSTGTSIWVNYEKGIRNFCGNVLPNGLRKNEKLPFKKPIITPTTKGIHDEPIDPDTIIARKIVTTKEWDEIADKAISLFKRGKEVAAQHDLILVDTKYEMGYDSDGILTIADEVHTPDSSRYWIANNYLDHLNKGLEPESLDKEFFRLWLREHGFEAGKDLPPVTDEVRIMLASKYICLYERLTGNNFILPTSPNILDRIETNLKKVL